MSKTILEFEAEDREFAKKPFEVTRTIYSKSERSQQFSNQIPFLITQVIAGQSCQNVWKNYVKIVINIKLPVSEQKHHRFG